MCCGNDSCVYWEQGNCMLDIITLDRQRQCKACILVDIPESILEKARKELQDRWYADNPYEILF